MIRYYMEFNKLIDLIQDQYIHFIERFATDGIEWYSSFQMKHDDSGLNVGKLFPELGPFILINQKDVPVVNLRFLLKRNFPIYLDDLVEYKIVQKNQELMSGVSSVGKINIFSAQLDEWKKNGSVIVSMKLREKGKTREAQELRSMILNTDSYLKSLNFIKSCETLISKFDKTDIIHESRSSIKLDDVKFSKINSYERFLEFLELSKYSNDFLLRLDSFKFDEDESEKLKSRLIKGKL